MAVRRDDDDPVGIVARAEASLLLAKRAGGGAVEIAPDLGADETVASGESEPLLSFDQRF